MNIIIPAAGNGQRFIDDVYSTPKPLINVLGEPMISRVIRSLKVDSSDVIHIVYTQDLEQYSFQSLLKKEFPDIPIRFVLLKYKTRGPVETVLCGLNQITDIDEKTLILDCDTFYTDEILGAFRQENENCIFYFSDTGVEPIFSYIQIQDNRVSDIQEKVRISDHACSGAYGFTSGRLLKTYCERVLNLEEKRRGEYYISSVYAQMLTDQAVIVPYLVNDFHCVGTPQQLQTYCLTHGTDRKRFCFDLDGTLVTFPEVKGDYSTVKPKMKNIKLARYLHDQGHTIIIQTARNMLSSQHNPGLAAARSNGEIFKTLAKYEIPFDEIYFGKPHAHFYIDDLSVKQYNIEREIGFYNAGIEARHFNQIEYGPDWVRKTTNNPGEVYWYQNIPHGLEKYFPKVLEIEGQTIRMEKVKGIVFSYLLVNNSLTWRNMESLLNALLEIHCREIRSADFNIQDNYSAKIAERYYGEFDYHSLSHSAEYYFTSIIEQLTKHKPVIGVIHGDPVFSNVFLCDHQRVKFIDMRGRVGDVLTLAGDIFYDYAKVYQSLWGYDFILNDVEINAVYLQDLRKSFESYFAEIFTAEKLECLKYITAGLLFSLIPLHDDPEKQKHYFNLMLEIIE